MYLWVLVDNQPFSPYLVQARLSHYHASLLYNTWGQNFPIFQGRKLERSKFCFVCEANKLQKILKIPLAKEICFVFCSTVQKFLLVPQDRQRDPKHHCNCLLEFMLLASILAEVEFNWNRKKRERGSLKHKFFVRSRNNKSMRNLKIEDQKLMLEDGRLEIGDMEIKYVGDGFLAVFF